MAWWSGAFGPVSNILITYLLNYLLTYLLTYLLHWAASFFRR